MEDEVLVAGIEPRISRFEYIDGGYEGVCDDFDFETFELSRPITRKPRFMAVASRYSNYIKRIVRINHSKSDFAKGLIVPEGKAESVLIELKLNGESVADRIWYTSHKTLLTHTSVNDFAEEDSQRFRKVVVEQRRILCNGFKCNHICYCKFFHESKSLQLEEIE